MTTLTSPPGIYPIVPQISELSLITLFSDEVYNVLCKLDPSKRPGPDEVTTRLLKELALELAGPLTCLFNRSLASGQFPEKWKMLILLLYINPVLRIL